MLPHHGAHSPLPWSTETQKCWSFCMTLWVHLQKMQSWVDLVLGLYFGKVITRFLQGEKRSKCISYHYYHWRMKGRSLAHKMLYHDTSSQMAKEMVSVPGHQSCYHMDEILRHITDDLLSWSTDWIFHSPGRAVELLYSLQKEHIEPSSELITSAVNSTWLHRFQTCFKVIEIRTWRRDVYCFSHTYPITCSSNTTSLLNARNVSDLMSDEPINLKR